MQFFRAVPRAGFDPTKRHVRLDTPRAPSNIPYVVDNLWEALRPDTMPSRRHAVYASPTPELARANASAPDTAASDYVVCELVLEGSYKLAHLDVTDARYHPDVRAIQHAVMDTMGKYFSSRTFLARAQVAPLFMPYLQQGDLELLEDAVPLVRRCFDAAAKVSQFWPSASRTIREDGSGELFIELFGQDSAYTLKPV